MSVAQRESQARWSAKSVDPTFDPRYFRPQQVALDRVGAGDRTVSVENFHPQLSVRGVHVYE